MRFSNGDEVEVTWDDEGFRGAWYEATVIRTMPKTRRYTVVYAHLVADEDRGGGVEPPPLREIADFTRVRPRPPRRDGPFAVHHPVDAWHNDGWWTGVVVSVAPDVGERTGGGERYTVCFSSPREQTEFAASDLRAHLEWIEGEWVRPDENTPGPEALAFPVGTQIEVASRIGDSLPTWFVATVEKHIWENNLLVQYERRHADAEGEFLREIVHVQHVRPCRSLISDVKKFRIHEEVEVFHDDGWCAGVITRIHGASMYDMKSEHWEGEMEFHQSKLRPWLEWTDGCWVQPSKPHQERSVRRSQRSLGRNGACKSHGSLYVPISSDSQDSITSSDTEMENGSTFECQTAISPSCYNPKNSDTLNDDMLLLDSLIKARAANSTVQAEKEFPPPAIRGRQESHINDTLTVQEPRSNKKSKWIIAEGLYFEGMIPSNVSLEKNNVELFFQLIFKEKWVQQSSVDIHELSIGLGENGTPVNDEFEHQSREHNYHCVSVNHGIKEVHHQLEWGHKCARRPRTNAPAQKRKVRTCPKKCRRNKVAEMGQHMNEKGGCRGRPSKVNVLNTETSLEEELLGDPRENKQLADKESSEPSKGTIHLLQLDPVVEDNTSSGEVAAQELSNVTASTYTGLNAVSDDMQLVQPVGAKENEALTAHVGCCESPGTVNEETEITTEVIPCSSPSKFNLPFVQSSSMWKAIAAMDVFHALPQQPHFRPLLKYSSELREGMSIGLMVTFDKLVTNITKLQSSDPENIFEERSKMLSHLEDHGFDVQCLRDRLDKLRRIRHQCRQHEDKKTSLQELILKRQNEGQRLTDEIDMIDRSDKELEKAMIILRDRRSALVVQRETNEREIVKLQIDEKAETQASLSAEDEFDSTVAASW